MKIKKSLLTLAFGTFGLGIAEFVMMGILPAVANDFGISLPKAGYLISAYALGVCVGAPLTVLIGRRYPLKTLLLTLVAIYATGNLFTALSPGYWSILLMRFVSGLPHGAFFGVGSIVSEKLADKGKKARAVALMISGMTVANLAGVPLGTFLSNQFSWRIIFMLNGAWGVFNLLCMLRWLPYLEPLPNTGLKGQFSFARKLSPWLLIGATAFANGGVFCMYSYVNPMMTDLAGFSIADMTWIMAACGLCMVLGNIIGGRLSDRFPMHYVLAGIHAVAACTLIALFFGAQQSYFALTMLLICSASLFAMGSPTQLLLLENSRGSEMLGAAFVQIAFNMGNAIGAWNGGLAISAGKSVNYTALIGAAYLLAAFSLVIFYSVWKQSQLIPSPLFHTRNRKKRH